MFLRINFGNVERAYIERGGFNGLEKFAQYLEGVVEEHSNTQASRPITHTVFVFIVIVDDD
jgi:hypothetical protein